MNYYTETIPPTLAEKLKEKGMPISKQHLRFAKPGESRLIRPTYAEVFDWLILRGINTLVRQGKTDFIVAVYSATKDNYFRKDTWHEAANAAIEKALELIKEK